MANKPKQVSIHSSVVMGIVLAHINAWSEIYDISFQFWGDGNNNVFIERGGVEVTSSGGFNSPLDALQWTLDWIYTANPSSRPEPNPYF